MKVVIIGPDWVNDTEILHQAIQASNYHITEVFICSITGVGHLAAEYAGSLRLPLRLYRADWRIYGDAAEYFSSREMIYRSEAVLAIWDELDEKTLKLITVARQMSKPVYIHRHSFYADPDPIIDTSENNS